MTSRQMEQRMRIAASRRRRRTRPGRSRQQPDPGEMRRLAQLVACGTIFVTLVAVKLLLPGRLAPLSARLEESLGRNMDVEAVFSAVGRVFAGEAEVSGAAREVYQAVFHPQDPGETPDVSLLLEAPSAIKTLQPYRLEAAEEAPPEEPPEGETASGETTASTLAYVLYSQQNLPENVSLEQAILGFDYQSPLTGVLTSPFGYRSHPTEGEERFHYGVDLAADTGTAIACFAQGTVTAVGESSSYGRYCIVSHEGGFSTLYAHCSRVTASSGARVGRGEKIAEVGQTGMATGPHLHFELMRNGVYLNPIYYVSAV